MLTYATQAAKYINEKGYGMLLQRILDSMSSACVCRRLIVSCPLGSLIVQYEFGIIHGAYLACMLREVKVRVLTTLHTVLKSFYEVCLTTIGGSAVNAACCT